MITDGRYSLIYESGDYRTVRVKSGKNAFTGKTILSIKQGKDYVGVGFLTETGKVNFWKRIRVEFPAEKLTRIQKAVDRIVADPDKAGLAYAMKENECYRCGKALTVPASVHKGMGPDCARKNWTRKDQQAVYRAKALGRIPDQDREWIEQKNMFAEQEREQEELATRRKFRLEESGVEG